MKKTDSFRKNGSNQRKPNNRQGNPSNRQGTATGKRPNQNSGARKGGLHPWVSSSAASSQALTSHLTSSSNNQSNGNTNRKPQNAKNPHRHKRNNTNPSGGQGGGKYPNRDRPARTHERTPRQPANATENKSSASTKPLTGNLDPFNLFCAYHLGIGPQKEYKPANLNAVARRFGQEPAIVRQALTECAMDSAALLDRDFDMALAQLDIQVAPEGIDRMELAKSIYEDFLAAPHVKRDWKKILEEDRQENRKVFG
ncbi:MAG: hypothetical protein HOH38_12100 [Nitrospinaceae bacterium]|nr:hypothetical protein [Nitrospinaceae bacterium]